MNKHRPSTFLLVIHLQFLMLLPGYALAVDDIAYECTDNRLVHKGVIQLRESQSTSEMTTSCGRRLTTHLGTAILELKNGDIHYINLMAARNRLLTRPRQIELLFAGITSVTRDGAYSFSSVSTADKYCRGIQLSQAIPFRISSGGSSEVPTLSCVIELVTPNNQKRRLRQPAS